MEFQVSIIRAVIYGAVSRGANFQQLCEKIGMHPYDLNDAERLVPLDDLIPLWTYAVEMTNDPLLGLHMGEEINLSAFGMLGYLMQSCPNMGEALKALSKYNNTLTSVLTYSFHADKATGSLQVDVNPYYETKSPLGSRQAVDLSISGIKTAMLITGKRMPALQVEFRHPKRNQAEYERALGTRVVFNAPVNRITFSKEDLDRPIVSYDKSMFALFSSLLIDKQRSLKQQKSFVEQVRQVILMNFKGQSPPVDVIASQMCMHPRSFQRKLAEEKSSYREVSQQVKKELALELMKSGSSRISEVAVLMGYADPTTFRRAFKGWTNILPKEARVKKQKEE